MVNFYMLWAYINCSFKCLVIKPVKLNDWKHIWDHQQLFVFQSIDINSDTLRQLLWFGVYNLNKIELICTEQSDFVDTD